MVDIEARKGQSEGLTLENSDRSGFMEHRPVGMTAAGFVIFCWLVGVGLAGPVEVFRRRSYLGSRTWSVGPIYVGSDCSPVRAFRISNIERSCGSESRVARQSAKVAPTRYSLYDAGFHSRLVPE